MLSSTLTRPGFIESNSAQRPQLRTSHSFAITRPSADDKIISSGLNTTLGSGRHWGSNLYKAAPRDSLQSNGGSPTIARRFTSYAVNTLPAQSLRPDINSFEPTGGSASLVQNSQAEPCERRGSASHFKLDMQDVISMPLPSVGSTSRNGHFVPSAWNDKPFRPIQDQAWSQALHGPTRATLKRSPPQHNSVLEKHREQAVQAYMDIQRDHMSWSSKSSASPTESQKDDSDFTMFARNGDARKGSLPMPRLSHDLLSAPNKAFARRPSHHDVPSLMNSLNSFSFNQPTHEENPPSPVPTSLDTSRNFTSRRPSAHLSSSMWCDPQPQELRRETAHNGNRPSAMLNHGQTQNSITTPVHQYNVFSQANNADDQRRNGYSGNISPRTHVENVPMPLSWNAPVPSYLNMNGARSNMPLQAEAQQFHMPYPFQTLSFQGYGQYAPTQPNSFNHHGGQTQSSIAASALHMQNPGPLLSHFSSRGSQAPSRAVHSSKFHEYRNNKNQKLGLRNVFGHIVELAGDQAGARFLQTQLDTASSDERARLFEEIMPNARQLSQDIYGNYVIQKLFDCGDQTQKKLLANTMKGHILALSTQQFACRVVQKALDHILVDQQAELISELNTDNRVTMCIGDSSGNHVIQKAIAVIPSQHIQFIYEALYGRIVQWSMNLYGCRVVQRLLEKQDEHVKQIVFAELSNCTPDLMMDAFGNYVAQYVIGHGDDYDRNRMIGLALTNVRTFVRHKFASNVIEKCILHGTHSQRMHIFNHVMETETPREQRAGLIVYVKCAFGNYVIQSLLQNLPHRYGQELCKALQPAVAQAKWDSKNDNNKHAKSIFAIVEKMQRFTIDVSHESRDSSRPGSMHSNGQVFTPSSLASSLTSGGLFPGEMAGSKVCPLPMSVSPIRIDFDPTPTNTVVASASNTPTA